MERRCYKAIKAHKDYASVLKECRSGINITENHLSSINEIASPLIDKDTLMVSEKTLYNYIDSCLLTAKNIDLPGKVKFKPRKKTSKTLKIDSKCRIGRTFEDFKNFCINNPDLPIVETDTVEGVKGGKILLTIIFRNCDLLLAFIRDSNTSQSVIDIFNKLDKPLGRTNFMKLFPVIVTDYTEFSIKPTTVLSFQTLVELNFMSWEIE